MPPQEEEDFAEDPELPEESPAVKDPHFDQEVGVGVGRRPTVQGCGLGNKLGELSSFSESFCIAQIVFCFFWGERRWNLAKKYCPHQK